MSRGSPSYLVPTGGDLVVLPKYLVPSIFLFGDGDLVFKGLDFVYTLLPLVILLSDDVGDERGLRFLDAKERNVVRVHKSRHLTGFARRWWWKAITYRSGVWVWPSSPQIVSCYPSPAFTGSGSLQPCCIVSPGAELTTNLLGLW